jgi:hypothetical protein
VTPVVFDPATDALDSAPSFPHAIDGAVALPDGRLVLEGFWQVIPGGCAVGGAYVTSPWIGVYDPDTGVTIQTHDPITGEGGLPVTPTRRYDAVALLPDGRVALIASGRIELLTIAPR